MFTKGFDYNLEFWKVFGVNHRVYELLDIFNIKRDKQADEKTFNRYIENPSDISNEAFFKISHTTQNCFFDLFDKLLIGDNEDSHFFSNQIYTTIFNLHMFDFLKIINKTHNISVCACQVAVLLEYMSSKKHDISLLEKGLEKENFSFIVDFYKSINTHAKQKDMALDLSYRLEDNIENLKKLGEFNISTCTAKKYEVKLSSWKNGKSLPNLMDMLVLNAVVSKNKSQEYKVSSLFQILTVRALLYVQKEFKIDKKIVEKFKLELKVHRQKLKEVFEKDDYSSKLATYQENFLIDFFSDFKEDKSFNDIYALIKKKSISFFENNIDNFENIEFYKEIDFKKIVSLFNEAEYKEVLDFFENKNKYDNEELVTKKAINFLLLLSSIKLKDKERIRKYFKEFDRNLGCIITMSDFNYESQKFVCLLEEVETYKDCSNKLTQYLEENCQLKGNF